VKSGGWPSIALIYLYGVLASASLSKLIPLEGDLAVHMGASSGQFRLLLALLPVAPALLATAAGSLIDRIGSRAALIAAATVGFAANLAYLFADSLHTFQLIRVFEGLIMVGAYSGAPALIMATTSPARRRSAMAFWSTYTPVGVSLGLLLSARFAGTDQWRGGYLIHMALFAVMVVVGFTLPRPPARMQRAPLSLGGLLSTWTQPGPLRVAFTFAMLIVMGFGLNTVFPSWYATQHHATVREAASLLSLANLVMIPGGFIAGALVARGMRDLRLLWMLMLLAALISLPLFAPGESRWLRVGALMFWQLASGAAIAVVTSTLPRVVKDATQGAAAAGLLSQVAAAVTFATPFVWTPIRDSGQWLLFVLVVALAALLATLLFPRAPRGAS